MPTSGTGISIADPSGDRARGFTLIEILVVVVIIGVVAVGAVLTISAPKRDDALETEAKRLDTLMNYVREHAELATREYGLRCEVNGYQFLVFDARRGLWRAVDEDDILRARSLPQGLRIRLRIEERDVVLRPPVKDEVLRPQVMLYSNGDVTPFVLTLGREALEMSAVLESSDDGSIDLQLPGTDAPRR